MRGSGSPVNHAQRVIAAVGTPVAGAPLPGALPAGVKDHLPRPAEIMARLCGRNAHQLPDRSCQQLVCMPAQMSHVSVSGLSWK